MSISVLNWFCATAVESLIAGSREMFPPKAGYFSVPGSPFGRVFSSDRLYVNFAIREFFPNLRTMIPARCGVFCLPDRQRSDNPSDSLSDFVGDNDENVRKGGRPCFVFESQLQEMACRVLHVYLGLP